MFGKLLLDIKKRHCKSLTWPRSTQHNTLFMDSLNAVYSFCYMSNTQKCSRVFKMFRMLYMYMYQWLFSLWIYDVIFRAGWSAHFLNGCCVTCSICSTVKINDYKDRSNMQILMKCISWTGVCYMSYMFNGLNKWSHH